MTRPDLHAAVSAEIAEQIARRPTGVTDPERAARMDALTARMRDEPAWFAAQPEHTRAAIATWSNWRVNNPASNDDPAKESA
jgi:hypothetical protein